MKLIEEMKIFYEEEFYNRIVCEFSRHEHNKEQQSLILYNAIIEFFKLLKFVSDPQFFINGLLYLNGFFLILNEHTEEEDEQF